MFETPAYAAAAGAPAGPSLLMQFLPLVLIVVIFYFLLIRPQQQRLKAHREMVAGLRRGDAVITQGGLIGKVHRLTDDEVTVELADNVRVRVVRETIASVRSKSEPAPAANDEQD